MQTRGVIPINKLKLILCMLTAALFLSACGNQNDIPEPLLVEEAHQQPEIIEAIADEIPNEETLEEDTLPEADDPEEEPETDDTSANVPQTLQAQLTGTWAWTTDNNYLYIFEENGQGSRGFASSMHPFLWNIDDGRLLIDTGGAFTEIWIPCIENNTLTIENFLDANITFSYTRVE